MTSEEIQDLHESIRKKAEDTIARQFKPEPDTMEFYLRKYPEFFKKNNKNNRPKEMKKELWKWEEWIWKRPGHLKDKWK